MSRVRCCTATESERAIAALPNSKVRNSRRLIGCPHAEDRAVLQCRQMSRIDRNACESSWSVNAHRLVVARGLVGTPADVSIAKFRGLPQQLGSWCASHPFNPQPAAAVRGHRQAQLRGGIDDVFIWADIKAQAVY